LLPQEQEIEAALRDKKISVASDDELDQLFRNVLMLVGVRPQYIPNQLEFLFLYEFVRSQYGGHTLSEIKLAFTKAAKGDLSENLDELKLYDYFTPAYFGAVMTKYRVWAREAGNKIADKVYVENLKLLDLPKTEIDWREVVEQDYQFFLSNIDASNTYPEDHYKILVQDGMIAENLWEKKFQSVKNNSLHELYKSEAMLSKSNLEKADNFKNLNLVQEKIKKYKTGEGDRDLELIAKQKVVLAFFKYNRELGIKNIYVPKQ
jgi:hypothetical protein